MTFAIHLEIAGLCLLVRRPQELLVLLPKTHDADDGIHRHLPVIGSDKVYQPDRTETQGWESGDYVHHPLDAQEIHFATDPELPRLSTDLTAFDICDISTCAAGHIDASKANARIHLPHGSPWIKHSGAFWKPHSNTTAKGVLMATRLTWRVAGLRNTAGSKLGLSVRITPNGGTAYDAIFRPTETDRTVRMHLYHTLKDELPGPPEPTAEEFLENQPAPHFSHYFDVLGSGHSCKPPLFSHVGTQNLLTGSGLSLGGGVKFLSESVVRSSAASGRRYSCVMATTSE